MSIVDDPIYQNADKAREWLEAVIWGGEPVCPHCGLVGVSKALRGKAHRPGVYKCKGCEQQFTVTVGTVFERSHIPLNKWLLAIHLMTASKKGISALQLSRMLGLTYKSAWFMAHRLREAMRDGTLPAKLGGFTIALTASSGRSGAPGRSSTLAISSHLMSVVMTSP